MLLNNFKPLIDFYPDSSFKNVLGNTVTKRSVMAGQYHDTSSTNGHTGEASNLTYNYDATSATNNFTKEAEYYKWTSIIGGNGSSDTDNGNTSRTHYRKNGLVLFVGSGNTAPTVEDYKLDTALELTVLGASCNHLNNGKTLVTRTFQNNTVEAVTVKEIGCYMFTVNPYNYSATPPKLFPIIMVGRIVLDAPVTLEVGEAYTFQYTIDMSNITLNGAGA